MGKVLGRWASPLAAGLLVTILLLVSMVVRLRTAEAGLHAVLVSGFSLAPVKAFAIKFVLTLLVPFYLATALALWGMTLALLTAFRRGFSTTWRPLEGFLFTFSALLWGHLLLWWETPTALWLVPGVRALPFALIFVLLLTAVLLFPVRWIQRQGLGWAKGTALLGSLLVVWSILPLAPAQLPRLLTPAKGGEDAAQVLIIGLDGLREDVGQANTATWQGTSYNHAYTVIPATRLLWHILWGGDPLFYTIGHAPPTKAEVLGDTPLPIIDEAYAKGWKPRFYIDDGGTIGLTGKISNFDDVVMPAAGWENFVNSNLSAGFPLFAVWENWGRAFPTTNPWAPLDGGLKEALRLGRGAKLVMFHSCLGHQPIFLNREELAAIPRWWAKAPRTLEPYMARQQVTPARIARYDSARDPYLAYSIRMKSILKAWEPIWNGLEQDPQYRGATRILFSDHGERFYHVTDRVQLAGVHGYNLDPWEARIMLKINGPGFQAPPGAPANPATISVLSIRDAVAKAVKDDAPLSRTLLETSYPDAPLRYQTLTMDLLTEDPPGMFREMDVKDLTMQTGIAPGGIWFVAQDLTEAKRSEEVTVAWGSGEAMVVTKPLKAGGALVYRYDGYHLKSVDKVTEEAYSLAKEKVKQVLQPR